MDSDLVDPSCLASDLVVHDKGGALRELQMSFACVNSSRAGSFGVKLFKVAADSNLEAGDEGMKIDMDDEPETLLDFLNTWRKKVAVSLFRVIPGLSHHIELELLNRLTFQLYLELFATMW